MKLHPLTIPIRGGSRAIGIGIAGFVLGSAGGGALGASGLLPPWASASGIILAVLGGGIAIGYEVLWHQRFAYELTADTLNIDSGVLFKREREIPLGRVQNVDIKRSLVQRVLGIARVNIETAGGGSTEASLQFVGVEEARRLQEEIRRRKQRAGEDSSGTEADETDLEARSRQEVTELFALDDSDLVLYSILSFDPRFLSILFVLIPSVAPMFAPGVDGMAGSLFLAFGIVGALAVGLGIWVLSAFARFVQFYGFRLTRVGDELRYERGLLQRYDGSIPLDKIQTVLIEENVLMRRFGYASLSVETAGYAPGSAPSGGSEAAIPLSKRDQLYELAQTIEPFEVPEFERPPAKARRRYMIRYSLVIGALLAIGFAISSFLVDFPWYVLAVLFVPVPLAARKKWAHRGWALLDGYVATRNGFWRRQVHIVPDFRVQTIIDRRTIFQRRWGLGTVIVDTASSRSLVSLDASAVDVDSAVAASLRDAVADRLQAAIGSSGASTEGAEGGPAGD